MSGKSIWDDRRIARRDGIMLLRIAGGAYALLNDSSRYVLPSASGERDANAGMHVHSNRMGRCYRVFSEFSALVCIGNEIRIRRAHLSEKLEACY